MLNSGKKICALCDKKKNILTLVLSEKKFLNETKNHSPHLQVKWSVPYTIKIITYKSSHIEKQEKYAYIRYINNYAKK